jgi:hypothetical protein
LHDIDFMVRDRKRFPDTGGWVYAEFDYDPTMGIDLPLKELVYEDEAGKVWLSYNQLPGPTTISSRVRCILATAEVGSLPTPWPLVYLQITRP